ncbi:MAG: TlyA family RNA methyltransferase [bacterium]
MSKGYLPLSEIIIKKNWAADLREAQALALSGRIRSKDGRIYNKPGQLVSIENSIELTGIDKFVSRGGDKLEGFLKYFNIDPQGSVCLDIGASTGGFTDCLLQKNAEKVYCVDVAKGKLDWKLRNDSRIVNLEKKNYRTLKKVDFDKKIDITCVDVSFSSCRNILIKLKELLPVDSQIILLFKPQFEVNSKYTVKGVVRNEVVVKKAINDFIGFVERLKIKLIGFKKSKVKGAKGNQEYFFYFIL